jgi:hypothetical protein
MRKDDNFIGIAIVSILFAFSHSSVVFVLGVGGNCVKFNSINIIVSSASNSNLDLTSITDFEDGLMVVSDWLVFGSQDLAVVLDSWGIVSFTGSFSQLPISNCV